MKNITSKLTSGTSVVIICAILIVSGSVAAETTSSNTVTSDTKASVDRITTRKTSLKLQLTAAQSQKIIKNCVSAQNTVKTILAEDKNHFTKRQQVYTNISSQLAIIVDGLSKKGIDTTEIKSNQLKFNDSANQYLIDADIYKTTMSDLAEMDCDSDPAGFLATLTAARQLRVKLASEVGQVASAKNLLVQNLTKASTELGKNTNNAAGVN